MKKYISLGVGVVLFFSPVLASAQTSPASGASLIAILTQLVQVLEQELQQLMSTQPQIQPQCGINYNANNPISFLNSSCSCPSGQTVSNGQCISQPTTAVSAPPAFTASCTANNAAALSWSAPSNATPSTTYEPIIYVPIADSCPSGWSDGGTSSANQNRECYISGFRGGTTTVSPPLVAGHSYVAYVYSQTNGVNSGTAAGPLYFSCGATTIANNTPSISSISQSSGPIGTQITINGSGFTGNNSQPLDVDFGGYDTYDVPSSNNGTSIDFTIPASEFSCNAHRTSPVVPGSDCAGGNISVQPGTYQIYVWNGNGTSNSVNFTVTGAQPTPVLQFNAFPDPSRTQREVDFNISVSPGSSIGSAPCPNEAANYTMDFGDGITAPVNFSSGCTVQLQTLTHTYSAAGPYTADLLSGSTVLNTVTISDSWASQFNGSSW